MPRSPEANEKLRDESRSRILSASLRLFAELGYERATIKAIAAEAGISQGLIYAHFTSKAELLRAIFAQSMADVRASFAAAEAADAPSARIEGLLRASSEILRRNADFWRLSYSLRMQPGVLQELGSGLDDWTQSIVETLEGFLREVGAPDPAVDAELLFALIDGMSQHYVLDPDDFPLEACIERAVDFYRALPKRPKRRMPA